MGVVCCIRCKIIWDKVVIYLSKMLLTWLESMGLSTCCCIISFIFIFCPKWHTNEDFGSMSLAPPHVGHWSFWIPLNQIVPQLIHFKTSYFNQLEHILSDNKSSPEYWVSLWFCDWRYALIYEAVYSHTLYIY